MTPPELNRPPPPPPPPPQPIAQAQWSTPVFAKSTPEQEATEKARDEAAHARHKAAYVATCGRCGQNGTAGMHGWHADELPATQIVNGAREKT